MGRPQWERPPASLCLETSLPRTTAVPIPYSSSFIPPPIKRASPPHSPSESLSLGPPWRPCSWCTGLLTPLGASPSLFSKPCRHKSNRVRKLPQRAFLLLKRREDGQTMAVPVSSKRTIAPGLCCGTISGREVVHEMVPRTKCLVVFPPADHFSLLPAVNVGFSSSATFILSRATAPRVLHRNKNFRPCPFFVKVPSGLPG